MFRFRGKQPPAPQPAPRREAGEADATIAQYGRWIAEQPERAAALNRKLAEELLARGRKADAVRAYLAAAAALERELRTIQALAVYRTILGLDPRNQEVLAKLGEIAAGPAAPPAFEAPLAVREQDPAMTIRTRLRKFVPLFSNFEREELTRIVEIMTPRQFEAGEIVFRQGDPGDSVLIIARGAVTLTVLGRDDRPHELERLGDGGVFGEVSALSGAPRNVTAVATSPTELLELTREYLEAVAIAHPRVWQVLEEFQQSRQPPVGV